MMINKNQFLFGAAYYEEYMPYDRLEQDMKLIRDAGMNVIRIAESTWSVEEPKDGAFDFSHVTRVIDMAAKYGINIIIGTPTYAIPAWLAEAYPDILSGNLYGHRQNMDITNPVYRKYAERMIRELVSRTAPLSNVIGFQIDNETKHYNINNKKLLSGFREWLRKRFDNNIKNLNDAYGLYHWSNSVESFEELPDPAGSVNGSYACAFEEYRRELAAEFLLWQSRVVSEYKRPDQFITHNFDYEWIFVGAPGQQDGHSGGVQPDINHYDAAKAVSLAGTDIYCPAGDFESGLTGQEIFFGGDMTRCLKRDNYIVLESQSQAFCGWLPYPGQLRLMALSHIASGARGVMYWPWASIHNGIESYWKGILSHDGEPDEIYDEIKKIGAELKKLSPKLMGLKKSNQIAVIVSAEAFHAMRWFPTDKNISYNDIINAFYRALYELNLECDILYDRDETDWGSYQLMIFPELYCCSDDFIQRVREYVSNGGVIFAGFRSFFADENLKIRHERQPYGLTDIFGMSYSRFTKSKNNNKNNYIWMDFIKPDTAEGLKYYRHPYWNQYAYLTRNQYNNKNNNKIGSAWYLGTLPENDELKSIILDIIKSAGISAPEIAWPIVQKQAIDSNGEKIIFLLNYSPQSREISCPVSGRNLITGESCRAGEKIFLRDWDAAILEENGV